MTADPYMDFAERYDWMKLDNPDREEFSSSLTVTGCDHDAKLDLTGWYCSNSDHKSHPVAQKQSNS